MDTETQIETQIRVSKRHYRQGTVDVEAIKGRVLKELQESNQESGDCNNRHGQRRSLRLIFATAVIPAVLVSTAGFTYYHRHFESWGTTTQQKPLSKEQQNNLNHQVNEITTPEGNFYRINHIVKLPENEIAYGTQNITSNTKEIVTAVGVFMKR